MKKEFKLKEMQKIAAEIITKISPYCEKVQIAGSIRRQKPTVSDIEIIYIPQYEVDDRFGLFNDSNQVLNNKLRTYLSTADFLKRVNKLGYTNFGEQIQLMLYKDNYPVDFFKTTPTGWAIEKLIRTGSKEFNIFIIEKAIEKGYKILVGNSCLQKIESNELIYPKSEEEIFKILGLENIPPEKRNTLQNYKRDYR